MPMSILLILFFSSIASASLDNLTDYHPDCACELSHHDPFESPQKYIQGKFKGQCVDMCRFRPAVILEEIKDRTLHIANIKGLPGYYSGQINPYDFDYLEVSFENFAPGIHHVYLQFHLKKSAPDLKMHRQGEQGRLTQTTRTIVLSGEGVLPKNMKHKLIDGYFKTYPIITRVLTGEAMEDWILNLGHTITTYPIKISPDKIAKILKYGILKSSQDSYAPTYNLFNQNCATTMLDLIYSQIYSQDNTIKKLSSWESYLSKFPLSFSIGTLGALIAQGLVSIE